MTTTEPFSAVAMCPRCGAVGVHWLDEANPPPTGDCPAAIAQRRLDLHFVGFIGRSLFEPPDAEVARVCNTCGHRWGQR